MSTTPIVYEQPMDVRFTDVDPYGHVSAPRYLEFVLSSRFVFLQRTRNITAKQLIDKGLGFFLVKSDIEYKRGIGDVDAIVAQSHVSHIEGTKLHVEFTLLSKDKAVTHATGKLLFLIIEMKTGKPGPLPDWAHDLFFR